MAHDYEVRSSETAYEGKIINVRKDLVAMPGGSDSQRDVIEHPGAVGIVAMDEQGRVLLLKQYRHPVGEKLWELPAGLLDKEGELAVDAAKRELSEEAGVSAQQWHVLVDALTSPGMTDEAIRIYLARNVSEISDKHQGEDEEADLELEWVDLDEALSSVAFGGIKNAMAVMGLFAAARARDRHFENLRGPDAPWPDRFKFVTQRVDTEGVATPPQ